MNYKKILKKSSMKHLLYKGSLCNKENFLKNIEDRMRILLNSYDLSNKRMAVHMKTVILPSIAVYKEMLSLGYTKEESLKMIKESAILANRGLAYLFKAIGKLPFGYSIFRKMCPIALNNSFCKPGWDIQWIKNNKETIEFHAKKCLYVDVMKKEECLELVPIFCQVDDYMYGNMDNVIWDRNKTLGNGDELCDFRFYSKNKKG